MDALGKIAEILQTEKKGIDDPTRKDTANV